MATLLSVNVGLPARRRVEGPGRPHRHLEDPVAGPVMARGSTSTATGRATWPGTAASSGP